MLQLLEIVGMRNNNNNNNNNDKDKYGAFATQFPRFFAAFVPFGTFATM